MKVIRKRRDSYVVLLIIGVILVAWFTVRFLPKTAFVFGSTSIAFFMLLIRQSRLLFDAGLIRDNPILSVTSAVVYTTNGQEKKDVQESIVSTFGILIGSRIYKWNSNGMHGVRLSMIEIDRARIYLTFGDGAETMRVELLHGITDEQAVMDVKQKLWRETGVTAVIHGW
jgi:hypothetical protein